MSNYQQIEVQFNSGPNRLAGVLTLPEGDGPHPAAVFVHGSGSTTRLGMGYTPMFENFAGHGVASLSWDKPGVGDSTGSFLVQDFHDRAAEVVDGIEFLRSRDDIDPERIGLRGISQAGWVMPIVIERVPEIAFMIAVSVPVSTVNGQNLYAARQSLALNGFSADEIAQAEEMTRELGALVAADAPFETARAAFAKYENERWAQLLISDPDNPERYEFVKRIATFDVQPLLKQITCPVLAIFGDKDMLVDVEESMAGYRSILAEAGNDDLTVKLFHDADHVIMRTETGNPTEMMARSQSGELDFVPGYIELMGGWLAERVGTA